MLFIVQQICFSFSTSQVSASRGYVHCYLRTLQCLHLLSACAFGVNSTLDGDNRMTSCIHHPSPEMRGLRDLMEVLKWMKGSDKDDVSKVHAVGKQSEINGNMFKFRFRKDLAKN